ncbi:MAG: dihydroorotase [bacterium]
MRLVIKDCLVFPSPPQPGVKNDVVVDNDIISSLQQPNTAGGDVIFSIPDGIIIPGLVDIHSHLREPGHEYKEDIRTGTLTAVSGGITTIAAMPNTVPVMDCLERINQYKKIISEKAVCRVIPVSAMTEGQQGKKLVDVEDLVENGIFLFSDDGFPIPPNILGEALKRTFAANAYIIQHPENPEKVGQGVVLQGKWSEYFKIKGIDPDSETEGIEQDLTVLKKQPGNLHFTHVSSAKSVKLISDAKKEGIMVSADATPHHLALTADRLKLAGSNAVMNPPLRGEQDRESIERALKEGVVDFIASDHAPHHDQEKRRELANVPKGVIGFQTMLGVSLKILQKHMDFSQIISLLTTKPADRFRLDAGRLIPGSNADFAVIVEQNWKVTSSRLSGKSRNTPFEGMELPYKIILTAVGGKVVYKSEDVEQYIKCSGKSIKKKNVL